jgi:putative sigma-54 modulation protein
MTIQIRAKGVHLSDTTKDYVEEKLETLKKYYGSIDTDAAQTTVEISANTEKSGASVNVEVRISVSKKTFIAEEKASTVEEGIDLVHDKLKTQLQRYKEKQQDHHAE